MDIVGFSPPVPMQDPEVQLPLPASYRRWQAGPGRWAGRILLLVPLGDVVGFLAAIWIGNVLCPADTSCVFQPLFLVPWWVGQTMVMLLCLCTLLGRVRRRFLATQERSAHTERLSMLDGADDRLEPSRRAMFLQRIESARDQTAAYQDARLHAFCLRALAWSLAGVGVIVLVLDGDRGAQVDSFIDASSFVGFLAVAAAHVFLATMFVRTARAARACTRIAKARRAAFDEELERLVRDGHASGTGPAQAGPSFRAWTASH